MSKNYRILIFLFIINNFIISAIGQNLLIYKMNVEDMFELADKNSRSIRTFEIAEKEAEQNIKIAKNALLPSIDISLSANYLGDGWLADRDFSNGEKAPMPHFGNNFALEASQIIYAGGSITNAIALAKLHKQSAQLDKETNIQEIRFFLVSNYLELYQLRNQAEVYARNIEQTQRLVTEIKAKQQEGLALKNDITRYELQLKSLELALTQIENGIIIINNRLITLLRLPQKTVIEIDTCLLDKLPLVSAEQQWQETASMASPVLKQAQTRIDQSKYQEKIAKAERLPSIALFASNYLDGPITIEVPPIDKNFNYWYIGVGLKFNLASVYKSGKTIKRARYANQKAIENNLLVQENTQTEVKADYIHFVESFTIYETQLKSLELATQNYEVIKNRYLNDLALITDMLDASNSKLSSELQVANARIHILFNYYKLRKTTGNL